MIKILILCTGNSCRSQMAEGWLKNMTNNTHNIEIYSAGTSPEKVNSYAVDVMSRFGLDISNNCSNHIDEYLNYNFDFVLTVCDNAKEKCPFFPSAKNIHHSFDDPANAKGSRSEVIEVYLRVCTEIRDYLKQFVSENIN